MRIDRLDELLARLAPTGQPYLEFVREAAMSAGLYVLAPGARDAQSPHTEDEIYIVLAGRSSFTASGQTRAVQAGDTLYVPAGEEHRFHDIAEELRLIVVFAPPEHSRASE